MSASVEDKLFLNRYQVDGDSHIKILDQGTCMQECENQECLYICPANVYQLEGDRIGVHFEGCLECGTCRIGCPHLNIEWRFPRGGFGVRHKVG